MAVEEEEEWGIYNISECLRLFVLPFTLCLLIHAHTLLSFTLPYRNESNVYIRSVPPRFL